MRYSLPLSQKNFSSLDIKWMVLVIFMIACGTRVTAQMAVNTDGTAPHSSAMLEVKSTNKGFLPPRVTQANRPASPATGLIIFQTDGAPGLYFYDGATWQKFGLTLYDYWQPNGADIYFITGRVSIGTNLPDANGLNVTNYVSGKAAVKGNNEFGGSTYATGMLGVLYPAGLGAPSYAYNAGVMGVKPNLGANGAAVLGWNNDDNTENYAGLFVSDGVSATATNYALFAESKGALINYAAQMRGRMLIQGHNGGTGGADSTANVLTTQVTHTRFNDTRAIDAYSRPQPGYGIGVYGSGGYRGVYGYADGAGYSGSVAGVYGYGFSGTGGTAYGVYGFASGGDNNYAGYFSGDVVVSSDLRVGTTTQATGYALSVNGKIACTEVLVQATSSWPDYVFSDNYELMSLPELENSIKINKHLPGIPSAREVEKNGISLGEMQTVLVEKVEELTLHLIDQNKLITDLQQEVKALKAENEAIRHSIKR
jgi:hypothetical protein